MPQTFPLNPITKDQFNEIEMNVRGRIYAILESLKPIIQQIKTQKVGTQNLEILATALYSHALEEYGKLILLQDEIKNAQQGSLTYDLSSIRSKWFNHDKKIELALNELGNDCKILREGNFDRSFFGNSKQFDTTDTVMDWNLRLEILNTDIDDDGNVVQPSLVDSSKLENAIKVFEIEHLKR